MKRIYVNAIVDGVVKIISMPIEAHNKIVAEAERQMELRKHQAHVRRFKQTKAKIMARRRLYGL